MARWGRSRPIQAIINRLRPPRPFVFPFTEPFSSGTWSNWLISSNGNPETALTVSSGVGVMAAPTPGGLGGGRAILYGAPLTTTDQGVLLTATFTGGTSGSQLSLILRGDATWGATNSSATFPRSNNGYRLRINPVNGFSFLKTVSGVEASLGYSLGSGTVTPTNDTSHKIRFEAVGTTLRWRCWPSAGIEPAIWSTAGPDTDLLAGVL